MKETKENEPQIREWTLDEALTSIGIGKVHYFIMLISGLIIGSLATETSSMNFIMKSAECDLDLTSAQKGLLSTAAYAGDMVTSLIWGYMSDTLGRRKVMKWSSLCMSVFSIVSSFSPNFIMFLIMRFFVGVFISSSNASIYPYLGEFMPIKFRQTIMSIASFSIGMALVYVPAIASFVLPLDIEFSVFGLFNYRSWRLLIVFCALPEIIGTIGLFCLPESPKYLIGQGRDSEALKVISWVYAKNSGHNEDEFHVKRLKSELSEDGKRNLFQAVSAQVIPILKRPYIKYLIVCSIITSACFSSSGSLVLWFSEIENGLSISNSTGTMCDILSKKRILPDSNNATNELNCDNSISVDVYGNSMILGTSYVIGYILIASLMQFIGRGFISVFCLFGSSLSGLALIWITNKILTLTLFILFISLSGVMVAVVTGAAVLLFPTNNRAMAVCIISIMGGLGTILGSNFLGAFLYVNCELSIGAIAGFVLFAAFINFLLPFK